MVFHTYNDDKFSILLKYSCDCILVKNKKEVFILEIDYFGLFKKNIANFQMIIWQKQVVLFYILILKPIVEYIIQRGAPINVFLKSLILT